MLVLAKNEPIFKAIIRISIEIHKNVVFFNQSGSNLFKWYMYIYTYMYVCVYTTYIILNTMHFIIYINCNIYYIHSHNVHNICINGYVDLLGQS